MHRGSGLRAWILQHVPQSTSGGYAGILLQKSKTGFCGSGLILFPRRSPWRFHFGPVPASPAHPSRIAALVP